MWLLKAINKSMIPLCDPWVSRQSKSTLTSTQGCQLQSLAIFLKSCRLLQVVTIGSTAVGIGVQCDDFRCEWDSVPFMQNSYTSGHRQLMLDCLGVETQATQPSQNNTQVTIAQRLFSRGRSFLNIVEMRSAIRETGADVQVVNLEGICHQHSRTAAFMHMSVSMHVLDPEHTPCKAQVTCSFEEC